MTPEEPTGAARGSDGRLAGLRRTGLNRILRRSPAFGFQEDDEDCCWHGAVPRLILSRIAGYPLEQPSGTVRRTGVVKLHRNWVPAW